MAENRITQPGPLHNDDGTLANPGYATQLLLDYDRTRIKAAKWRIKEWDYYLINDDCFAVALTLSDLGYIGLLSASVINLQHNVSVTQSCVVPFPMGKFGLPSTSEQGVSRFENGRVLFEFTVEGGKRTLHMQFDKFKDGESLILDATLDKEPRDTMVIATPWAEDPKAFYYNQKIVAMRASGSFKMGSFIHGFNPQVSFGLLDWGRGVWTRDNTWFWACAQGWQDGQGNSTPGTHRVGLNLGYGFGDTSAASENMIFIDGVMHKLLEVDFGVPKTEEHEVAKRTEDKYRLMEPWHVTDSQGKLDLVFTPGHDRVDMMNYGLVLSDQHQVFGSFSGTVQIDGEPFVIADLLGSAEIIHNKY